MKTRILLNIITRILLNIIIMMLMLKKKEKVMVATSVKF